MAPFIAAALPALVQAIPELIRSFGKGEVTERNAKAAEAVQREKRMAERQEAAEENRRVEAELRSKSASGQPKKKKGPADNMDPDVLL